MARFNVIVITAITQVSEDRTPVPASEVYEAAYILLDRWDRLGGMDGSVVEHECKCIQWERRKFGIRSAEDKFGPLDVMRAQFVATLPGVKQGDIDFDEDVNWAQYIHPFMVHANHAMRSTADISAVPDCRMCQGTGRLQLQRSLVEGKYNSYSFDANLCNMSAQYDRTFDSFSNNEACRVVDIDWTTTDPFAVITPDGVWHGMGAIDEYGVVTSKNDNWKLHWHSEALKYPSNIAILARCQI